MKPPELPIGQWHELFGLAGGLLAFAPEHPSAKGFTYIEARRLAAGGAMLRAVQRCGNARLESKPVRVSAEMLGDLRQCWSDSRRAPVTLPRFERMNDEIKPATRPTAATQRPRSSRTTTARPRSGRARRT